MTPPDLLALPAPLAAALLGLEAPHGSDWLFLGVAGAIVLGPLVAARLRLPGIIGVLLGGLLIGPQVLGIVTSTDTTVSSLGQLGLLYLMFTAGLELDLALFRQYRRAAVIFGLMTFAVPLGLGFMSGRLLDYSPEASLLLGSIWASHTLVTYPVVRAAGLAGNRAVATAVSATALTDTLALIVLAAVSGSETGDDSTAGVVVSLVLGLIVLMVYTLALLPRVSRWFFTTYAQDRTARYAYLLLAMLSAAVLAEVVEIEGLVGAFFAGLGLNLLVPGRSALMERAEFFGEAIFVPLFLVSVGILIDPSVMVRPGTLGLAVVFSAVVVGGKALAAMVARPLLGFTGGEAGLMAGLTTSQAAATLAATFVGFDIGLFGEQVVNAVLVVILVTLILAALTTERFVGRVEPTPVDRVAIGRRIVVPMSQEDRLATLGWVASAVAAPDGGLVTPLRVGTTSAHDVESDRGLLSLAQKAFAATGLDVEPRLRVSREASQAVVATVVEEEATLVLLDWQIVSRYQPSLRGGRDDQFVDACPVPVLLASMSDVAVRRVVLLLERPCFEPPAAASLALAVQLVDRLQGDDGEVALAPEGPEEVARRSADLPEEMSARLSQLLQAGTPATGDGADGADTAESEGSDGSTAGPPGQRSGDLVVLAAHPDWDCFGPAAQRAFAHPGVSVLVVADLPGVAAPVPAGDHGERGLGVLVGRSTSPTLRWR